MELYCTRPSCPRPINAFADLDDSTQLKTTQQKYCMACGMPLLLQGRYLPLRLLGRGGFGAAFLARDRFTPKMRQCVVKQFQPAGNLTADQLHLAQKLFEREGDVLEDLGNRHPEIPDLLAFFQLDVPSRAAGRTTETFFYLVQEFVDGQTMEEELAQKGRFSEAEVVSLLEKLLPVLQFVHENGTIHRDIKPSNVMRHRDGRIYLLDFGAVKQVTSAAAVAGQAGRASTGIYSMGYAPPEQMAGSTVYPATDLYALAVTCITLLTGKQPGELYDAYSNTWNWRAYAQVSDRLEAILNRLLQPIPSQRFQSAGEVLAALRQLSAASPTPPPPAAAKAAKGAKVAPSPPKAPATAVQSSPSPGPKPPAPAPGPPRPAKLARPRFSTLELLGGAAFTGFEAGLLAVALASLLGTTTALQFWLTLVAIMAALVFAQSRRWIERVDLIIFAVVTLSLMIFIPHLQSIMTIQPVLSQIVGAVGSPLRAVLFLATLTALVAVAVTIVFRLIYALLARLL